jgi:hypothetical protein
VDLHVSRQAGRRERGFTLVLFSLTLVGLLVFAAFAIDLGALYNHRRQDQNAADSAALAAAHLLGGDEDEIDNDVQVFADRSGMDLDAADWDTCAADPGALANVVSGANCISWSLRRVRVRIPDQQYETTFGSVVGADEFRHGAFAIAALIPEGMGGVLPYAVTGSSAEGGFGCLQTNSNGQASSWCGSTSGNFGFLDFSHYGDPDLRTSKSCGSGDTNIRLRNNTAMGVDHDLSLFGEEYSTAVVDTTACATLTPAPNAANTQTGNQADDITDGLFRMDTFPDGNPARLRRVDGHLFGTGGTEATVYGESNVDDNNLWRFIPANYGPTETNDADMPESCERDQFVDSTGNYYGATANNPNVPDDIEAFLRSPGLAQPRDRILGLLARCFAHYRGLTWNGAPMGSLSTPESRDVTDCAATMCTAPVFALNSSDEDKPDLFDIQYTPRFGYVPQISDFPSGTSASRSFIRFRPIYIYRVLFEVTSGTVIFDPGVTPTAPTSGTYNRIGETSVFVFPDGMLPGGLASQDAPSEIGVNRFVRLTR